MLYNIIKIKINKHNKQKGDNTMIKLIYNNEIIDTANDIDEALYLKEEYKLAFHTDNIEIEINF